MLRLHMINALCGMYITIASHVLGSWWPSTRIPVFIGVAFFYVAGALAANLRVLRRGKPTALVRMVELTPLPPHPFSPPDNLPRVHFCPEKSQFSDVRIGYP